ncbi:kinase-like protein [Rhizophagus irregularis]|uniref:Kinase-like protein n=1 Tax=Rhizophagus irregularis TaxID=588596 RepID=A0A2I1E2Q5_9GLOM|nr:kinase-like protein [Rhizophagus irregularis]PKY16422.1 kinase-like protein [Rhizophagus irregularis]CAB5329072.1 unnamed protein product [Rhizophagus irregularis]
MREIINEINLMIIASNPNIIRFFGITKLKDELSLVLEYADGGTLKKYLSDNATTLIKWETQLKFANETAAAISWLHHNKIIHGDLHPKNILIHQHTIKLADFGCSRLQGLDYYSEGFTKPRGIIPYMDPKILDNNKSYDLTEKSDIYSLGMVFWELTSCLSPFDFENNLKKNNDTIKIVLGILDGKRENPIPNTNSKFVTLYKKCWRHEPDERPDIQQVISEFNSIDPIIPIDSENNNISENINSIDESDATEKSENEDSDLPDSPGCEDCDINIKCK